MRSSSPKLPATTRPSHVSPKEFRAVQQTKPFRPTQTWRWEWGWRGQQGRELCAVACRRRGPALVEVVGGAVPPHLPPSPQPHGDCPGRLSAAPAGSPGGRPRRTGPGPGRRRRRPAPRSARPRWQRRRPAAPARPRWRWRPAAGCRGVQGWAAVMRGLEGAPQGARDSSCRPTCALLPTTCSSTHPPRQPQASAPHLQVGQRGVGLRQRLLNVHAQSVVDHGPHAAADAHQVVADQALRAGCGGAGAGAGRAGRPTFRSVRG